MNQITTQNPQTLELLKGSFQLLQLETFFNSDPSDSNLLKSLWIRPKRSHLDSLDEKILFEGVMEKKGRRTSQWKSRYYILTDEFLAYKEVAYKTTLNNDYLEVTI